MHLSSCGLCVRGLDFRFSAAFSAPANQLTTDLATSLGIILICPKHARAVSETDSKHVSRFLDSLGVVRCCMVRSDVGNDTTKPLGDCPIERVVIGSERRAQERERRR